MAGMIVMLMLAQAQPVATLTATQAQLLAAHNGERVALKQPPLIWDEALAKRADGWAITLARTGKFDHDSQKTDGENLWMGTRGAYNPAEMVGGWIAEKKDYKPGRFPDVSRTGQWADVGHYTQLIWGRTTAVGCAIRANAENEFLVCRYSPPGNWIGEFATPNQPIRARATPRSGRTRTK
jgi:Cysteine-rich secretory protein family